MDFTAVDQKQLDEVVKKTASKKGMYGCVFAITSGDGSLSWSGASGNLREDSKYYIASINKMFISAMVLRLISEGKLDFDDYLADFLPPEMIECLHIFQGRDYSNDITILHLLSQTSGLPCYLEDQPRNGTAPIKELAAGIDQAWPTEKVIERIKNLTPHFAPGESGKAKYIDTNHQLLGCVVESIVGKPMVRMLDELFEELHLADTYVCKDRNDKGYVFPYY